MIFRYSLILIFPLSAIVTPMMSSRVTSGLFIVEDMTTAISDMLCASAPTAPLYFGRFSRHYRLLLTRKYADRYMDVSFRLCF